MTINPFSLLIVFIDDDALAVRLREKSGEWIGELSPTRQSHTQKIAFEFEGNPLVAFDCLRFKFCSWTPRLVQRPVLAPWYLNAP